MKKFLIYLLTLYLSFLTFLPEGIAQRSRNFERPTGFQVHLIAGTNFSQLDGDNLIGYSKIGLRAGAQINYALYAKGGLGLGMFYDEKGSSSSFSLVSHGMPQNTKLKYLSIPVDFYFDSGYRADIAKYRIRVQIGASVSRLFSATSNHQSFGNMTEQFNNFDISPNIGLTYFVSRKSGLNIRFESSITNIMDENIPLEVDNLRSYLFSLQYVYSL